MSELIHEPPFTKKRAGKLYVWAADLEVAFAFAAEHGLRFELATADYQVAKLIGDDVRLLIYPHKTPNTGNVSLRVRDENSRNQDRADDLMAALDAAVPYRNTFSRHLSMAAWERLKARRKRLEAVS